MGRTAIVLGLVAACALPAQADTGAASGGAAAGEAGEDGGRRGHHRGQVGLSLSFATGYRFIKPWDGDVYCGARAEGSDGGGNAAYCTSRTPVTLDLSLTYGITRTVELMLDLRLGLERDFGATDGADGPRLRQYAPGVRFWLTTGGPVDWFSTAQLAIDTTGYADGGGDDLGAEVRIRNANGLQVDFHDAFGAYVYFAEQLSFRRWLEVGLEAGIGLQGRYP